MTMESAHTDCSDEELACQTQAGSLGAFEELARRYEGRLLNFLIQWGADYHQAQDLVQTSLVTAYRKIHLYKPEYKFSAWVYTITRRKSISHFRSAKTLVEMTKDEVDYTTPADIVTADDRYTRLWASARQCLTADQFLVTWMRYREDCSVLDIASATGKSESSVKVLLFRARNALAVELAESEESPVTRADTARSGDVGAGSLNLAGGVA